MTNLIILFLASILAGILGRMGGAGRPYRTWHRDWLIPLVFLALLYLWCKPAINYKVYIAYFIIYPLMAGAFTTYWDSVFGYDNLLFSGFVVGISAMPCIIFGLQVYAILIRAILLAVVWELLKRLPQKVLFWRKDIAEEFLRYFSVVLSLPLLTI